MLKRLEKNMQNNTTLLANCFVLEQNILFTYLFYFILHKKYLFYYITM